MKEFSTALKSEQVKIDGVTYEIREMTKAERDKHLKRLSSSLEVKMIGTGQQSSKGQEILRKEITVKDLGGAQEEILLNTMYRVNEDGSKTRITKQLLDSWGAQLVEELYAIANQVNGMDVPETTLAGEAEKN